MGSDTGDIGLPCLVRRLYIKLVVKRDSSIRSAADLKGKKLAIYAIGSTGTTLIRIALADVNRAHGQTGAWRTTFRFFDLVDFS